MLGRGRRIFLGHGGAGKVVGCKEEEEEEEEEDPYILPWLKRSETDCGIQSYLRWYMHICVLRGSE